MVLVVIGGGGLVLFGGVLLIGWIVGSFELDVVLVVGDVIWVSVFYFYVFFLVLVGIFIKSV